MLDNSLIQAVLEKKHGAFTIFYNKVVDHFYAYLKSNFSILENDIDDIISNTFIKIWNKLDSFDANKGNFNTWIWTILRNTTKDYFKKKNEYFFSDFDYTTADGETLKIEDTIEDSLVYEDILENDYKIEQIKNALDSLKPNEKEIIYLRYNQGYSLKEIANIVGLKEGNIRVKIHRILAKLKSKLADKS